MNGRRPRCCRHLLTPRCTSHTARQNSWPFVQLPDSSVAQEHGLRLLVQVHGFLNVGIAVDQFIVHMLRFANKPFLNQCDKSALPGIRFHRRRRFAIARVGADLGHPVDTAGRWRSPGRRATTRPRSGGPDLATPQAPRAWQCFLCLLMSHAPWTARLLGLERHRHRHPIGGTRHTGRKKRKGGSWQKSKTRTRNGRACIV